MSNSPVPAKYDPNRVPSGQFAKGNRANKGRYTDSIEKFHDLQELWYGATCVDDMRMVKDELLKLCKQDTELDVKLKACVYVTDRTYGKVPERVDMNVNQEDAGWRADKLSEDDLALWEGLVRKALGASDPSPEIVVSPSEESGGRA